MLCLGCVVTQVLSVEVCASADMGRIVSRLAKEGDAVELLGTGTLALCLNDAGSECAAAVMGGGCCGDSRGLVA